VRSGDANALPEPGLVTGAPPLIPLRELVTVERTITDKSIYHKNLMPVTYVIGDVAGAVESPSLRHSENEPCHRRRLIAMLQSKFTTPFNRSPTTRPRSNGMAEWHITIEVFRDLGTAFAACLVLIFVLMVGWFRSFRTPVIVMMAIPFSLVGIMPAHWRARSVLQRDLDDWLHGRRRHRGTELDHPRGFY
jgi:multidrug efflux pump subunit AcrB